MNIVSTPTPSVNSILDPVVFDLVYNWIRKRIGRDDIGSKVPGKNGKPPHPAHSYKTETVFTRYQRIRAGLRAYPEGLTRQHFIAHFTNQATFYFTASGKADVGEILVNIDIDCKNGIGNRAGAQAFAEYLRANYFPDLYIETSTNGNGAHCYFVLAKGSMTALRLNVVLRQLDAFLKAVLASGDWDVENVEIMGRPPEFTWGPGKFNLIGYKAGLLAKLPREAVERHSELMATTRITVAQLNRMIATHSVLLATAIVPESTAPDTIPITKPVKRGARATSAPRKPGNKPKKSAAKTTKSVGGSVTGHIISDEQAKEIDTTFMRIARGWFQPIALKSRHRVEFHDVAVFLCILRSFLLHPNANGAMPTKRFQVAWEDLHKRGYARHAWNHSRFKVIRDWFSQHDQIDWIDRSYTIGQDFGHGFVKGEAAKWGAGLFLAGVFAGGEEQTETHQEQETTLCAQKHAYPDCPSDGCLMLPYPRPICVGFVGQVARLTG